MIPVIGTSLYVFVKVTVLVPSPARLVFPVSAVARESASAAVLLVTVCVPFSTTVTLGAYPSAAPTSVTTYLVPAGRLLNTFCPPSASVKVYS